MGHFRIFNQLLVFFTAKNILVLTLQLYRLAVITLDFRATILQKSRKGEVSCCPCEPYEASTQATAEQDTEMKEFIDFPVREKSQAPPKDQWAQLLTQNQLYFSQLPQKGLAYFYGQTDFEHINHLFHQEINFFWTVGEISEAKVIEMERFVSYWILVGFD